jgi:hypothetical protein
MKAASRAISSTRSFTLRLRSRNLVPTSPEILVIFFIARVSTRSRSQSKLCIASCGLHRLIAPASAGAFAYRVCFMRQRTRDGHFDLPAQCRKPTYCGVIIPLPRPAWTALPVS